MVTNKFYISEKIGQVSYEIIEASSPKALMVLSHGAGAGIYHTFMVSLAEQLAKEEISTFRFQFPYMENGKKRPDTKLVTQKTIAAAISEAERLHPGIPLLGGGKSFGGRMLSLYAASNIHSLKGLVFYGFPLHPTGKPSMERAGHLKNVKCPMLFLQGSRDKLATPELIKEVTDSLPNATLINLEGADHSFHMLKKSGIKDEAVIFELARRTINWFAF